RYVIKASQRKTAATDVEAVGRLVRAAQRSADRDLRQHVKLDAAREFPVSHFGLENRELLVGDVVVRRILKAVATGSVVFVGIVVVAARVRASRPGGIVRPHPAVQISDTPMELGQLLMMLGLGLAV